MAISSCPKCAGHFFEIKVSEPRGGNYKENFIQCSSCGTVVSAVGYYNSGVLLKEQEKEIAKLGRRISNIESALDTINGNIIKLARIVKSG